MTEDSSLRVLDAEAVPLQLFWECSSLRSAPSVAQRIRSAGKNRDEQDANGPQVKNRSNPSATSENTLSKTIP